MLLTLAEFRVWLKCYYVANSDRFNICFPSEINFERHRNYDFFLHVILQIGATVSITGTPCALFAHSRRYQAIRLINLKVQSLRSVQDKLSYWPRKYPLFTEPEISSHYSQIYCHRTPSFTNSYHLNFTRLVSLRFFLIISLHHGLRVQIQVYFNNYQLHFWSLL